MTEAIKQADPNHLVSLGTMGSGQCGTANGDYRMVHEPVDICEYHDYDYEGNPADNADNPMPGDEWNGLAERLEQCGPYGLNKPLFVGEVGISSDVSLDRRAEFFAAKLEAQTAAGVDGFVLWDKVLETSDADSVAGGHEGYGIGYGDPTENVTRAYGEPWDGTAQPWTEEAATPTPQKKCKPKRGKGKGKGGKGRCRPR